MIKKIIKRILGKDKAELEVLKKANEGVTAFEQDIDEQPAVPVQKNSGDEDLIEED